MVTMEGLLHRVEIQLGISNSKQKHQTIATANKNDVNDKQGHTNSFTNYSVELHAQNRNLRRMAGFHTHS